MLKKQNYGFSKANPIEYKAKSVTLINNYKEFETLNLKMSNVDKEKSFYISTTELEKIMVNLRRKNADGIKITPGIKIKKNGGIEVEKTLQLIVNLITFNNDLDYSHTEDSEMFYWTIERNVIEPPIINIPTSGGSGGTT